MPTIPPNLRSQFACSSTSITSCLEAFKYLSSEQHCLSRTLPCYLFCFVVNFFSTLPCNLSMASCFRGCQIPVSQFWLLCSDITFLRLSPLLVIFGEVTFSCISPCLALKKLHHLPFSDTQTALVYMSRSRNNFVTNQCHRPFTLPLCVLSHTFCLLDSISFTIQRV